MNTISRILDEGHRVSKTILANVDSGALPLSIAPDSLDRLPAR